MAQPLIYGAVGPKGGDYLLEFNYVSSWDQYTLYNPFSVLGGTAAAALAEGFTDAFEYVSLYYEVGRFTHNYVGYDEGFEGIVNPFFSGGVEIELRYAGGSSGGYSVNLDLRPNGDFYWPLHYAWHSAGPDGELVVRITCTPTSMKVYANGVQVHELDPQTIDWDWVGPQPHYWMHLKVGKVFSRTSPGELVSVDGSLRFFRGSSVPHIREISYSLPRSQAPAFFRDFVRAYEIAGEGSGAVSPPPPPPPPTDDLSGDTVVTIDVPSASPIPIESLPFRAIFSYALGAPEETPPVFALTLDTGTYKFSTALSPGREEHDTQIALISFAEGTVYVNDDISDGSPYDRRSEITMALPAGEYAIAVGTSGMIFGADGSLDLSGATQIPPGTVLRVSKV
ncbi:hypothetical protein [Comamonas jiangduensis]|uniref:hypothetical protein n=1 Tax=Comamonas jiangduensis TaxID=1194168 RepID=UPI003BF8B6ED